MSPGPELAAALARLDVSQVASGDLPVLLRARSRQRSHDEAEFLRLIAEMGQRDPDAGLDRAVNIAEQSRYAADELRVALAWTRRAAETTQCYADSLVLGLPQVHAALSAGVIDPAKAHVFQRHLLNLTGEQIETICTAMLPHAGQMTTGQLAARLARMIIAVDPGRARDQYERAITARAVIAYLNEDGTATLTARGLAPDEAAAACQRIHHLAEQVKRAGHPGTLDQIKTDIMLGLLDGRFEAMTHDHIIATLTDEPGTHPDSGAKPGAGGAETTSAPTERARSESARGGGAETTSAPAEGARADVGRPSRVCDRARTTGIELSVELATLLGHNDHPATIPGLGPVLAKIARRVIARQRRAEWRFAIVDDAGHFLFGGITRRRPTHTTDTADGGIVELLIPLALLDELAGNSRRSGSWQTLVADITEQHRNREQRLHDLDDQPDSRFPKSGLRRHVQQRDRTCRGPGCRRPATTTEYDHTREYRQDGPTTSRNGGSFCPHDHDLKSTGGWRLDQPQPGEFVWHTPLGQTHHTRGEPILYPLPDIAETDADRPPY